MAKVLISVVPNVDITQPPGILGILASCCEQVGYEYEIFDLSLHMHKKLGFDLAKSVEVDFQMNEFSAQKNKDEYEKCCNDYIDFIHEYQPDYVAISVFTWHSVLAAKVLLEIIKTTKFDKTFKIILGGLGLQKKPDTKILPFGEYCLQKKLCDHIVIGEGEKAFVELLKNNLSYPGIDNNPPKQLMSLDDLPSPSYKKIKPQDYFYSEFPEITVTGSKGCVRKCSFCDVVNYWNRFVYKDGTIVANDLYKIYQDTGVQHFNFSDSLINGSMKSYRAFCKQMIHLRAQDKDFKPTFRGQFICRPKNQMNEQDFIDMKNAGAHTLVVGIESFSEKIRDHMGKKFDNQSIDFHIKMCAKYQIKTVLLFICGYLTETLNEHQENLDGLKKYQKYALSRVINAINVNVNGLNINYGTPLYNKAEELGIISTDGYKTVTYTNNPDLNEIESIRRSAEFIYTAAKLGYGVLHFPYKLETMRLLFDFAKKQTIDFDHPQMQLQNKDTQHAL